MKWGWLPQVTKEVTKAERTYREGFENLDAFERCMKVLARLRKLRSLRQEHGEDVKEMDDILREAFTEFDEILKTDAGTLEECDLDFDTWADKIEDNVKEVDDLFLGFDSEEEDAEELKKKDKRKRRRQKEKFIGEWRSGEYRQRVLFLTFAWFVALIGMFVAIGYLARDFIIAQRNLAVQIIRSPAKPLYLPAITVCNELWDIPSFSEYPTKKYPGLPLFSISLYMRGNRSSISSQMTTSYPDILPGAKKSPVEEVIVSSNPEKCLGIKKGFDVKRERDSLFLIGHRHSKTWPTSDFDNCLHCLRIGVRRRELLPPPADWNVEKFFSPAIQMTVVNSRLFGACQSSVLRGDSYVMTLIQKEVFVHEKGLVDQRILDFGGTNVSVAQAATKVMNMKERNDFLCNTYFFSGFFYPSLDNANISYRFSRPDPNSMNGRWEKTGLGPYYTAFRPERHGILVSGPSLDDMHNDTFVLTSLRLYAEDVEGVNKSSTVNPKTSIGHLARHMCGARFMFKKMQQRGKPCLKTMVANMPSRFYSMRAVDSYDIGFDYETFEEERIELYPTMGWQEFLTDVFEFIGLFTGVCIFTLIAGSANRVAVQ